MSKISVIERTWIENFSKSPLVDETSRLFKSDFAHQLFYERPAESTYPDDFPTNFSGFYFNVGNTDVLRSVETCCVFLNFTGIGIDRKKAIEHIRQNPTDYKKFVEKCYYILKTLAHNQTLTLTEPFRDSFREIDYFLRIECGEPQLKLFDEPLYLPDLYSRFKNFPEGYEKNTIVKQLFDRLENSNDSFYITGKAGTGKSTFIQYFAKKTRKKMLLCAFTGIAAINVGGQTIHSFSSSPRNPCCPKMMI